MQTKEKEVMMRAARSLHGTMLIEKVKCWRRGEIGDAEVALAAKNALQAVKDVEIMLDPPEEPAAVITPTIVPPPPAKQEKAK